MVLADGSSCKPGRAGREAVWPCLSYGPVVVLGARQDGNIESTDRTWNISWEAELDEAVADTELSSSQE